MKYACIRELSDKYPVKTVCSVLQVGRAAYYCFLKKSPSARSREDLVLRQEIVKVHTEHRWTPGAVKTWLLLNARGIQCGKHRVARLRKLEGIQSCRSKRFKVMSAKDRSEPPVPDLVRRGVSVPEPNKVWVGDITAIRTKEGWLHLAIVLDLFARRVVGWAMAPAQTALLPTAALQMAIVQRRPKPGLVFHSDQGSVYSSGTFRALTTASGIQVSMSRRGNCHDNAVAESFFSNLKNELMHEIQFPNRAEGMAAVADYIENYYNRRRIHQSLGFQTPASAESQSSVAN